VRAAPVAATAEEINAARRDRRMDIKDAPEDRSATLPPPIRQAKGPPPFIPLIPAESGIQCFGFRRVGSYCKRGSNSAPASAGTRGDFTDPTPPGASFAGAPARPPRSGRE